jgi:molybdenum cofactor cytidylyltransferase
MNFGEIPVGEAEGCLLAHSTKAGDKSFKKGRRLSAEDIALLTGAGIETVIAARLEPGDLHEDEAATKLAKALTGNRLELSAAFTGRCNLLAGDAGLLRVDKARLDRINLLDEAITVATLPDFEPVEPRQMAATVKIIPFAVPTARIEVAVEIAREDGPLLSVHPFASKKVGLIQTTLPGLKTALLEKTVEAANQRLAALGCPPVEERRVPHDASAIAEAIGEMRRRDFDILLVSGASAIVDRRDVVPAGIEAAGGAVEHFGMPVDPGNLILLANDAKGPILGLPGCARSPKLNGFDWVLQRLIADIRVTPEDIMRMGAGGLLKEIGGRPLPRAQAVEKPQARKAPRIAVVVLAAGLSSRMGDDNKLLLEADGKSLVRRAAETARASQAVQVSVVVGHEAAAVSAEVRDLDVKIVENPHFAEGLSSSLRAGLSDLPDDVDGAIVLLADMPDIRPETLDTLISAFDPAESRSLCVPTFEGQWGNPVLIGRRFFPEALAIVGDRGAREILRDYPEQLAEVAVTDPGILRDIDSPEDAATLA